jgi:hypothetical protein
MWPNWRFLLTAADPLLGLGRCRPAAARALNVRQRQPGAFMIRGTAGLCVAFVLVGTRPAAAQAPVPIGPTLAAARFTAELAPPAPERDLAALSAELRRATRPSHWLEGGLIGAALLGAGALAFSAGMCSEDNGTDNCTGAIIGGAVVGAGLGFTIGSLIGGQIPREAPASATP